MLRTLDPTPFNAIASHPEVRPWIGLSDPTAPVDFAPVVTNPENVCFLSEDRLGGYMLVKLLPGLYVAHTLAVPGESTGMKRLMRDGFSTMFMATDCVEIVTTVPDENPRADRWAQIAGFRETFRREKVFDLMGQRVGLSFRSLDFMAWAIRESNNEQLGRLVHQRIEAVQGHVDHAPDPVHDRLVGACIGCAIEGNVHKGVMLYNRAAAVSGYAPVRLVSANPPLVDMGTAVIQLLSGRFDVLVAKPPPAASS